MYILDREKLQKDVLKRLNDLKKPQRYLETKLNLSRATLYRLNKKNKGLTLETFFKLTNWLSEEPNRYFKIVKPTKTKKP